MRRVLLAAAIGLLALSGCGNEAASRPPAAATPTTPPNDGPATRITADGVYEVGEDVAAGVWTSTDRSCIGYTATRADFDLDNDDEGLIAIAVDLPDLHRIVTHDGEFFSSRECPAGWRLETDDGPKSLDPATLAGGCEILVGDDDLVSQVVSYLRRPRAAQKRAEAGVLAERLMVPVFAHNRPLGDPAGQLVDALDAPRYYVTQSGEPTRDVARAVAKIRSACRGT